MNDVSGYISILFVQDSMIFATNHSQPNFVLNFISAYAINLPRQTLRRRRSLKLQDPSLSQFRVNRNV